MNFWWNDLEKILKTSFKDQILKPRLEDQVVMGRFGGAIGGGGIGKTNRGEESLNKTLEAPLRKFGFCKIPEIPGIRNTPAQAKIQ